MASTREERDGALNADTTIERWRVVVVVLATLAALPLFVLENPDAIGSVTAVAGASVLPHEAAPLETAAPAPTTMPRVRSVVSEQFPPVTVEISSAIAAAKNAQAEEIAAQIIAEARAQAIVEFAVTAQQERKQAELLAAQEAQVAEEARLAEEHRQADQAAQAAEEARLAEEQRQADLDYSTSASPTTVAPATPAIPGGPTAEQWDDLRRCESTNNYQAVNPTGSYRGAYQFSRQTWDWIASIFDHVNHLEGVDPIEASPTDQDLMAQTLYDFRGPGQWPECGRFLL